MLPLLREPFTSPACACPSACAQRLHRLPSARSRRRGACRAARAHASSRADLAQSMSLLGLTQVDDLQSVKKAYYMKMRELHPDVCRHQGKDTTVAATEINEAYAELVEAVEAQTAQAQRFCADPFDCPGEAMCAFVDPFAVQIDPCQWKVLQEAVTNHMAVGYSPEDALSALGLPAMPGAVTYLTEGQLAAVHEMLSDMEMTLAFDVVAWNLRECLLRAAKANKRRF